MAKTNVSVNVDNEIRKYSTEKALEHEIGAIFVANQDTQWYKKHYVFIRSARADLVCLNDGTIIGNNKYYLDTQWLEKVSDLTLVVKL